MPDVKWIKLSTNMFDDEKIRIIEQMPDADTILIIWIKLLSQAGKTNASGYIYLNENIPYTDEMLSTIFNRPISTVRLALKTFKSFGMIEIDDYQYLSVTNWEKHQNIEGLEKIRKQNRIRKQKEREKKRLTEKKVDSHVTVTESHATELELDLELETDIELEEDIELQQEQEPASSRKENVYEFYQKNVGVLSPYIAEEIGYCIDDLNDDLVMMALSIALENQKPFSYAKAIMKTWADRNVKTVDEANILSAEFKQKSGYRKQGKEDIVPDWFKQQKEEKSKISEFKQPEENDQPNVSELLADYKKKKILKQG